MGGWSQPETQFPDVAVRLKAGRVLEFELGEWLHQAQMGAAKRRESLEEQLLAALGSLGNNPTSNVRFVLLEPYEPAPRFDAKDSEAFRRQLFELITAIDSRYDQERGWYSR